MKKRASSRELEKRGRGDTHKLSHMHAAGQSSKEFGETERGFVCLFLAGSVKKGERGKERTHSHGGAVTVNL